MKLPSLTMILVLAYIFQIQEPGNLLESRLLSQLLAVHTFLISPVHKIVITLFVSLNTDKPSLIIYPIPQPILGWAIDNSLYGTDAETTADPDGDGLDNQSEFNLG